MKVDLCNPAFMIYSYRCTMVRIIYVDEKSLENKHLTSDYYELCFIKTAWNKYKSLMIRRFLHLTCSQSARYVVLTV